MKLKIFVLVAVLILSHVIYESHLVPQGTLRAAATQDVNVPPMVEVLPDVSNGKAPLTVHFEGEAWDEDGKILSLEWDFQGDGVFEFVKDLQSVPGNERAQMIKQELRREHTYSTPGIYHALVRVTDDKEESAVASVTIQVFSDLPWLDIVPSNRGEFAFMAVAGYEAFFKRDITEEAILPVEQSQEEMCTLMNMIQEDEVLR